VPGKTKDDCVARFKSIREKVLKAQNSPDWYEPACLLIQAREFISL
jgi:hypothetical protein